MATTALWTRPGETLVRVLPTAGICRRHRVPVQRAMFTFGRYQHASYGSQREDFPCYRHADGSVCEYRTHVPDPDLFAALSVLDADAYHAAVRALPLCPDCHGPYTYGLIEQTEQASSCHLLDECPGCGANESFTRRDTGYGWDVTCTSCGWNHYYDSGD